MLPSSDSSVPPSSASRPPRTCPPPAKPGCRQGGPPRTRPRRRTRRGGRQRSCTFRSETDAHGEGYFSWIAREHVDVGVGALNELTIEDVADIEREVVARPVVVEGRIETGEGRHFEIGGRK